MKRNRYHLVEKKNRLACHGIFDSRASIEKHLKDMIPVYCSKGYFTDKTLRPDDFEIINPDDLKD